MARVIRILLVAAAAAILWTPGDANAAEIPAGVAFSRVDGADENVLRLVRLLDAAGFSRVTFSGAEAADGGRSVRLFGVKARGLENYDLSAASVAVVGLERVGSRISAQSIDFQDAAFRKYDGAGVAVSSRRISFERPETTVAAVTPRLRFDRLSVTESRFVDRGKEVANVREASLSAADWMPGSEMARKLEGSLVGSISPSAFGGSVLSLAARLGAEVPLNLSGSLNFQEPGSLSASLRIGTGTLGLYEVRLEAENIPADAFSAIREVEEVTRYSGSSKPFSVVSRLAKAESAVKVRLLSLRGEGMEWLGPAMDKEAKARGQRRERLVSEVAEIVGGWVGVLASDGVASDTGSEVAKFLRDPHRFVLQVAPASPAGLHKNWFSNIAGVRLDELGFSFRAD